MPSNPLSPSRQSDLPKTTSDIVTCCLKPSMLPTVLRIEYKRLQELAPASLTLLLPLPVSVSLTSTQTSMFQNWAGDKVEQGTPSRGKFRGKDSEADGRPWREVLRAQTGARQACACSRHNVHWYKSLNLCEPEAIHLQRGIKHHPQAPATVWRK